MWYSKNVEHFSTCTKITPNHSKLYFFRLETCGKTHFLFRLLLLDGAMDQSETPLGWSARTPSFRQGIICKVWSSSFEVTFGQPRTAKLNYILRNAAESLIIPGLCFRIHALQNGFGWTHLAQARWKAPSDDPKQENALQEHRKLGRDRVKTQPLLSGHSRKFQPPGGVINLSFLPLH